MGNPWVTGLRAGDPRAVQAANMLLRRMAQIGDLSETHLRALELAADGLTYAETAERLGCSPETVKRNIQQAMLRLGARNRTHAVAIAWRRGMIN